jgi:hypothetical protein
MPAPKKKSPKKAVTKPAKKTKVKRFNNPTGCTQCSCTRYQQDYGQICTCGHGSRSHTGN